MTINSFIHGMQRFSDEYKVIFDRVRNDEMRSALGDEKDYYEFLPGIADPYYNTNTISSSTKRNECIHLIVATYCICVNSILPDIKGMTQELISLAEEMEDAMTRTGRQLMAMSARDFTNNNPELSDLLLSYYMTVLAFHDQFRTHIFSRKEIYAKDEFIAKKIAGAFHTFMET